MNPVGPSIPFHVAQAYGVPAPRQHAPAPDQAGPIKIADRLSTSGAPSSVRELVAAPVPGGIDFATNQPTSPMSLYRHPADRNEAATGVSVGRHLDLNG